MPAPQLHMTFAELLAEEKALSAPLRRAVQDEPVYLRLGSMFPDLPYYRNVAWMAVRYGLRRPAEQSIWAWRMHRQQPARFFAGFIAKAAGMAAAVARGRGRSRDHDHKQRQELSEGELLSLITGLAAHVALDECLHPLVGWCARRDLLELGGEESHHHRLVEKYHSLFFHLERLGEDVVGTRALRHKTRVVKQPSLFVSRAEASVVRFAVEVLRDAYGEPLAAAEFRRWVRSFAQFGVLVSGQMAARNSRRFRRQELRARYYRNQIFDFTDFYQAAQRRALSLADLAHAFVRRQDLSPAACEALAAASKITDLVEPWPCGLPRLPALPLSAPACPSAFSASAIASASAASAIASASAASAIASASAASAIASASAASAASTVPSASACSSPGSPATRAHRRANTTGGGP